jgi:hypothetical protein
MVLQFIVYILLGLKTLLCFFYLLIVSTWIKAIFLQCAASSGCVVGCGFYGDLFVVVEGSP